MVHLQLHSFSFCLTGHLPHFLYRTDGYWFVVGNSEEIPLALFCSVTDGELNEMLMMNIHLKHVYSLQ